jgi:hypothetical protein
MQRTLLQRAFFVGGWTVAFLFCVLTGLGAYTIGYFDGSVDSGPLGMRPRRFTAADVIRTIGYAFDAPPPPGHSP